MKKKPGITLGSCFFIVVAIVCGIFFGGSKGVEFRMGNTLEITGMVSNGCFICDELSYKGRLYQSVSNFEPEALIDWDTEPEKVYVNKGHYFADDPEILCQVTCEGNLYKAKGYDKDFRVIIMYTWLGATGEEITSCKMFDGLNGITMKYGRELYQDRLHLENYDTVSVYYGDERDAKNDLEKHEVEKHEIDKEIADEILNLLCKAKFIEESQKTAEIEKSLKNDWDFKLHCVMKDGTEVTVCLNKDGYALYPGYHTTEAIVKIDAEKLEELLTK